MQILFTRYTLIALYLVTSMASESPATVRTVAFSGDVPAAAGDSISFNGFTAPAINNHGQTAFLAYLGGTGVTSVNNAGIWSESENDLKLVARLGDIVPGPPSQLAFTKLTNVLVSDAGQVVFSARYSGGAGIWTNRGTGLQPVTYVGMPKEIIPGLEIAMGGSLYSDFYPTINDVGQIAFNSYVYGQGFVPINNHSDESTGTWVDRDTSGLIPIALENNLLIESPAWFVGYGTDQPRINNQGQLAFVGYRPNNFGIMKTNLEGTIVDVALTGQSAPGAIEPYHNLIASPTIDSFGRVAFWGTTLDLMGIWSEGRGQELELIARSGSPAPGVNGGDVFGHLGSPVLSGNGRAAFAAFLDDPKVESGLGRTGIWAQDENYTVKLVALQGELAPGASDGDVFGILFHSSSPAVNHSGRIAFWASVRKPGSFGSGRTGVWAQDVTGALQCIVVAGQQIDVDDGPGSDLRTVSWVDFVGDAGSEDGRPSGFNNLGQIAFMAQFTDGSSGIFVSDRVAVPEPVLAPLLVTAMLALYCSQMSRMRTVSF